MSRRLLPLSPFIMTHIGEPTQRSMSSSGSNCVAMSCRLSAVDAHLTRPGQEEGDALVHTSRTGRRRSLRLNGKVRAARSYPCG